MSYASFIDHTLLRADASEEEIVQLCAEAQTYGFFSVCVAPCYVALAKRQLSTTSVNVCTVVGFPLGYQLRETKLLETRQALQQGADEIDMVVSIAALKKQCPSVVAEIRALKDICADHVLKVIVETALLCADQIRAATRICVEAGADFIKTSTGFSTRGASLEDIQIMRQAGQEQIKIKASGGIKDLDFMKTLIAAGAHRIGSSQSVRMIQQTCT